MRLACVASVSVVQCRKSELESKIRNPGNFCLWNAECGKILLMESGIQLEILLTFGIQNPSSTDKIGLTPLHESCFLRVMGSWCSHKMAYIRVRNPILPRLARLRVAPEGSGKREAKPVKPREQWSGNNEKPRRSFVLPSLRKPPQDLCRLAPGFPALDEL